MHQCITKNAGSFCEDCLALFEVIEFCLSTENEYVGIGARHTENLVHEIWRKKCIGSAAIKGSDPAL